MEFSTMFHLLEYLKVNGDQNAVLEKRDAKSPETFLAAASIYQTLFNRMTIPTDENTMLFDEFKNDLEYLKEDPEDFGKVQYDVLRKKYKTPDQYNILATFEIIFMVGWKYHESQQKAKQPKLEQNFSFRDVMNEIELKEGKGSVKYGTISEDTSFDEIDKINLKIKK